MKKIIPVLTLAALAAAASVAQPAASLEKKDTAVVSGVIERRDTSATYDNLLLYYTNPLNGAQIPIQVPIAADGSFEAPVPMVCPGYVSLTGIEGLFQKYYLEPGRTLELVIRPGAQKDSVVQFAGVLAEINRGLAGAPSSGWNNIDKLAHDSVPQAALRKLEADYLHNLARAEDYIASAHPCPEAEALIRADLKGQYLTDILDYEMCRRFIALTPGDTSDPSQKEPVTPEFFDAIRDAMAHHDAGLLSCSSIGILLNRLAFSSFSGYQQSLVIEGSGRTVLDAIVSDVVRKAEAVRTFAGTDSVPLLWQCASAACLSGYKLINPSDYTEADVMAALGSIFAKGALTDPAVCRGLKDFFTDAYATFEIPDDERGRLLRDIIGPDRGKMILLDFWATSCGPCRWDIEVHAAERERNRHNPGFKIIFITGEEESPAQAYDEYVAANLAGEDCRRLPQSDINRLRDLFRFSAIPHYVLIDREGKVISRELSFNGLKDTFSPHGVDVE